MDIRYNMFNLKLSWEIPENIINEKKVRYIKLIAFVVIFKKFVLSFFFIKIFKTKP